MGTITLHLIDKSRTDPFTPGAARELMVQLWYPATSVTSGHQLAACFSPLLAKAAIGESVQCRTHAYDSAPVDRQARLFNKIALPWAKPRVHPVVIYSPGWGSSRSFGTALIEELAGRGYIVAAVDHPYDAALVEFPGGRAVELKATEDKEPTDLAGLDAANLPLLALRTPDIRFVLDALKEIQDGRNPDAENKNLPAGLTGALDLAHIGMLGHSLGGTTAAQVMRDDPRIRASLLLDSPIPPDVRKSGLDKPIMLMASEQPDPNNVIATAWNELQPRGWHRAVKLKNSGHLSFTDLSFLCPQMGEACTGADKKAVGSIDGLRAIEVQRAYVTAFFGRHLKDHHESMLDKPPKRYPEVESMP